MNSDNKSNDFKKPDVDEDYLLNIISGDEPDTRAKNNQHRGIPREIKPEPKEKIRRVLLRK